MLGILEDLKAGRFVYRGPGSFWAWFRKRVHYRLLDELRRQRKQCAREQPSGTAGDEALDRPGPIDPAVAAEHLEFLSAMDDCLARIANADQRAALGLRLIHDLSYEEIACSMGSPLNTVRSWIRRGRQELRRCLATRLDLELHVELSKERGNG